MARYGRGHDVEREDSAISIESDGDSFLASPPGEESPLLPTDLPADIVPPKSFQRLVIGLVVLFLILIEIGEYLSDPPEMSIIEGILCRERYPDHQLLSASDSDPRCKDTEIQKEIAMIRSWAMSLESLIPLFVQIPFGIIADKYGRRPVLFLSLFGIYIEHIWTLAILRFPDTFSVWAVLWTKVAYLIGGGSPMGAAMLWTILSDTVPVAERTGVFFFVNGAMLIPSFVLNAVTAYLMGFGAWIPIWIGLAAMTLATFMTLLFPETLKLRQKADDKRRHEHPPTDIANEMPEDAGADLTKGGVLRRAWFSVKNDTAHLVRFIVTSKSIMWLIVAYCLYFPVKISYSINMLQYMTKRFNWTWAEATYVTTIGSFTSVIVLLVLLPAASVIITKRFHFEPMERDLFLGRLSLVSATIGTIGVSFASTPWLFIVAVSINSLGAGFSSLIRALLNAIVEPHTIGTLNTTLAFLDTMIGFLSAPAMGWLFSRSMDLGGMWMGLSWMAAAVLSAVVLGLVLGFRTPKGIAQAERH